MKKNFIVASVFLLCLLFAGCSSSISGRLTGFDKEAVPNSLIRLLVVDNSGDEIQEIGFTVTDGDGGFDLGLKNNVGSSFIVEAVLPDGTLRGFSCGDGSKVDLNPLTDAVYRSVIYVTESKDGRSLEDFSRREIQDLTLKATRDKDLWDLDLSDTDGLVNAVIAKLGMDIPNDAGGSFSAVPLADIEAPNQRTDDNPAFSTDTADHPCFRDNYWLKSSLFGFDILKDGAICNGSSSELGLFTAYGIAFQLRVENDTFDITGTGEFPGDNCGDSPLLECPSISVEDSREVVFGPVTTTAGLLVTRKVYVPEIGDFVRYIEIFSNPTASDININVKIYGGLGVGEFEVYGTGIQTLVEQSGNLLIGSEDSWAASVAATPDTPHPTVGFVWDGLSGSVRSDKLSFPPANGQKTFSYWWDDVTIPAGGTKVFMHYSFLSGYRVADVASALLDGAYNSPDETGMSTEELESLENFAVTRGNIAGEAGSVPSFADILISNDNQSDSVTVKARRDGGFNANISAVAGDKIRIGISLDGNQLAEKLISVP